MIIVLFFLYKTNYQMDVFQLANKCLGTFFYTSTQNHGLQPAQNLHHVTDDIINHRKACKTYAGTHKSFREKLEKISTTYIILKKHPAKKKRETFSNNLKQFTEECESLFDIRTSEKNRQKTQEELWNFKEPSFDKEFYRGQ